MSCRSGAPWLALLHGWALVQRGEVESGIAQLVAARDAMAGNGVRIFSTYVRFFLADAYRRANRCDAALAAIEEGLQIAALTLDRTWEAELWRLR